MKTLQEKYNAVAEGSFAKSQFVRDASMQLPNLISKVNSYDDTVNILKNRGMIAEAKMQEPKYYTAKPEDAIAPDVLDTGIKFELDKKYGTLDVTPEQYEKCKAIAVSNLTKDVLYYVKQDSVQLEAPGEKMEKVVVKEEVSEMGNEPVMLNKALITQLLKDFLADADPRDEVAKAYVASVMRDFKSGDPSRTTQYATWQSMDDLEDDFNDYMGQRMDEKKDGSLEEELPGENPLKFKEADAFDPTKFYIKDLKSGRILNAVSVQGSKLISYYDTEADAQAQADWITRWEGDPGRFVVLSGDEAKDQVNKQTGVEQGDLEELFGMGGGKVADAELITKLTITNFRDVAPVTDISRLGLKPNEYAIKDVDNNNFVVYLKGLNPQGGAIPNKFRDQKTAQAILNSLLKTNNALGMNKLSKNLQVVSGGGAVNEQQLKELFKKIITKVITE